MRFIDYLLDTLKHLPEPEPPCLRGKVRNKAALKKRQDNEEKILELLETGGPQTATDLAKQLGYTASGLHKVLHEMQERGFLYKGGVGKSKEGMKARVWFLRDFRI